ncbi:unnamed protein product, partial [marine sediment metagenome]
PGILEKEILLKARFYFDQYINLRPIRLYKGVPCPLKDKNPEDINFYVVRENTEDFYVGIGGRFKAKTHQDNLEILRKLYKTKIKIGFNLEQEEEIAYQIGLISKSGTQRVMKYTFELAKKKDMKRVTSVDKANVLTNIYGLWRDVFNAISAQYPDIETEFTFVDAITMWFVRKPEWFKVVVAPNMFGDIITDLGAMIQGGLGIAAGGNINPEGISMFEPIHGSAPKYKDKSIANPTATILAGAMMLDFLGEVKLAKTIEDAVEKVLSEGKVRSHDLLINSLKQSPTFSNSSINIFPKDFFTANVSRVSLISKISSIISVVTLETAAPFRGMVVTNPSFSNLLKASLMGARLILMALANSSSSKRVPGFRLPLII